MAVLGSLQHTATVKQKEAQLVLLLQSSRLTDPIILVEGADDYDFYRRHLGSQTKVIIPINDKGNGNCHLVTQVTENLHTKFTRCNVIGIRDRDYTLYKMPPESFSEWILFSDGHSLECMLLKSQSVQNEMINLLPRLSNQLQTVLDDCRHIAGYYIFDAYNGLNIAFNSCNMHLINYFDVQMRQMKVSWKQLLANDFRANCGDLLHGEPQNTLVALGVDAQCDLDICRGHDIIDVCYEMGKAKGIEKKELVRLLIKAYTKNDFLNSGVRQDLHHLETNKAISIL